MIEFFTSPKARIAAEIMDELAKTIGHVHASRWMLASHDALGTSPIEAIKAGRHDDVRALAQTIASVIG